MDAILQNEYTVYIPWVFNIIPILRGILPVPVFDSLLDMLYVTKNMKQFKGRAKL
jgi:hypothetical protein